jgi:hypothetical protein
VPRLKGQRCCFGVWLGRAVAPVSPGALRAREMMQQNLMLTPQVSKPEVLAKVDSCLESDFQYARVSGLGTY